MSEPACAWTLDGTDEDETRLLRHAGGFSMPVPGHPTLRPSPPQEPGQPRYDAIVTMADLPIELGVRLDDLPASVNPEPLASTMVLTYAANRGATNPFVRAQRAEWLAAGADAAACATYALPVEGGKHMEHLTVTIRREGPNALSALYTSCRFFTPDINPIRWSNLRGAVFTKLHWVRDTPRTAAPALWPVDSKWAEPGVKLTLRPEAWAEAVGKARDLQGVEFDALQPVLDLLLRLASSDDSPPTTPLPSIVIDFASRDVAGVSPPGLDQIFLRNITRLATVHDFRAWVSQCIWGISNRNALDQLTRAD